MRLNGWQRIWVVAATLWIVGVAAAGLMNRNRDSDSELYHSWSNDLLAYLVEQVPELQSYSVGSLRSVYDDKSDKELINDLHDKYIGRHPAYRYGFAAIDDRYAGRLSAKVSTMRYVVMGLFVPGLLYLTGWSVAWVRKGFKGA